MIGGYRIDPVIDGEGDFAPAEVLPHASGVQWEPHRDLLDGRGRLWLAIGGFLVRGRDRTVMVDLGYGPGSLAGIATGGLLGRFAALGVTPSDVTDVLFTHLHVDHVGWASVDGVPQFPNATFRCGAADYRHFVVERNDRFADERLRPCENRFESFDDGPAVLPGVTTVAAPGHTPGSTVIVVSDGTERVMMLGDVVHWPVQLLEDGWNTPWDLDPDLARQTRRRLLRELEGDPSLLLTGGHFPGLRFGRLLVARGRRRWVV